MTGTGNTSPVATIRRSDEAASGRFSNSGVIMRKTVGTPPATVTFSRSIADSAPAASKRGCMTRRQPTVTALASRLNPVRCAIAVVASTTSRSFSPHSATLANDATTRFALVPTAPLGRPVVPEV